MSNWSTHVYPWLAPAAAWAALGLALLLVELVEFLWRRRLAAPLRRDSPALENPLVAPSMDWRPDGGARDWRGAAFAAGSRLFLPCALGYWFFVAPRWYPALKYEAAAVAVGTTACLGAFIGAEARARLEHHALTRGGALATLLSPADFVAAMRARVAAWTWVAVRVALFWWVVLVEVFLREEPPWGVGPTIAVSGALLLLWAMNLAAGFWHRASAAAAGSLWGMPPPGKIAFLCAADAAFCAARLTALTIYLQTHHHFDPRHFHYMTVALGGLVETMVLLGRIAWGRACWRRAEARLFAEFERAGGGRG